MRDDQLKLELFRIKARLHLIERLCLKAYIVGVALSTEVPYAQAHEHTIEALEQAASVGEIGLDRLFDHCGRPFGCDTIYQDDEGSVLIAAGGKIALLDDRELARFADQPEALARIARSEVPMRFRFIPDPKP